MGLAAVAIMLTTDMLINIIMGDKILKLASYLCIDMELVVV